MSNVIKSNGYVSLEEIRKLEALAFRPPDLQDSEPQDTGKTDVPEQVQRSEKLAEQLLSDAKAAADELLRSASEEAAGRLEQAAAEIEKWWDERRLADLSTVEESRKSGFETGYREGLEQARSEANETYGSLLQQAAHLVEEAHAVKERVVHEAEPFLVELATAIAKKIIGEHLAVEPEWTKSHVRRTLERRREKGLITLCVAPSQFAKMQDSRAELTLAVDSEAELVIVPDATVDEGGCVVRTSFGSIDARIDTQLAELKAALMEVASQTEEGAGVS